MAISIRTFNQILGDMIRKIIAETPVNDINTGSVLLTLLEAVASNDFENNVAVLNVLELLNIDALKNNDLDNRAADFGLSRNPAVKASGFVTISDSNITKLSTGLYPVKPAPIKGSTKIFVNDASTWANTGTLYIGRGTGQFEGPIPYTSIVNSGTFFTINLGSSLQKDHLISDGVVDAQGTTDRLISAGTIVSIPANNQNPEIRYTSLRDAVIPAGEDSVSNVEVLAIVPGSAANAGINTIVNFTALPFSGATVTNTTAFTNGADVEGDVALRERIKSYAQTLARGTKQAILSGIVGISDAEDNKQVASAVITEPVKASDPSIVYIDDGGGFQPSFAGQSVDILVNDANGKEEFLQLANFPLPRPQVVNAADGPYQLVDGMQLRVLVDDDEEIVNFSTDQFSNISAATLPEIVVAINDQTQLFKARLTDNSTHLLIYTNDFNNETIQVGALRLSDDPTFYANGVLKFPTNQFSYISLYQNNKRLREKQKSANLTTALFVNWNVTVAGNLIIEVDGTPPQDRTFDTTDFNGVSFPSLTLNDWVPVFNSKFAGITATATSGGALLITSNKSGGESSLKVVGGTLLPKLFPDIATESVGQDPQFQLNRQSGNIRILGDIAEHDVISAGTADAKGSEISLPTVTGNYNVSSDSSSRPAEIVVVADAVSVIPKAVTLAIGSTIAVSDQGSGVMRVLSSSAATFRDVQPFDFIYITNRGDIDGSGTGPWLDIKDCGIYKVFDKGQHTTDNVDTYLEVKNDDIVAGSYTTQAGEDIQAFSSDKYPQLWKGTFVSNPPAAPIQDIVDSLNSKLVNVKASIFKTNSVKLTTSTEEGGSIAIPVSVGNAKLLFEGHSGQQDGNPSHIANRRSDKDLITTFRRTVPTNTNVFLGRYTYTDVKGNLDVDAVPGVEGFDPYSEELKSTGVLNTSNVDYKDLISLTQGNNKQVYRSIKQLLSLDRAGTQYSLPATIMDHMAGDKFQVLRSLELSSEDSAVVIMDKDVTTKTIDIPLWRTGRVNSGSQSMSFTPTTTSFSANDADNEPGVDFGTPQVWSTTLNHTNFSDYAVWMRARNFYVTGGVGTAGPSTGEMLVRSFQYGPTGEKTRFAIDYPSFPNKTNTTTFANAPEINTFKYFFGSGAARTANITAGSNFAVTSLGPNQFRYTWDAAVDLSTVQIGDVFSALPDSGISPFNGGQLRVKAVNAGAFYFDVYNPNGIVTPPGNPEVTSITTIADDPGSPSVHDVTATSEASGGGINGKYFVLTDSGGTVAVWYDVNNAGTLQPLAGTNRYIKVATVLTGDSATTVAQKTAQYLNLDPEFTVSGLSATITVTNTVNGFRPAGSSGTLGFTVTQTSVGVDPVSLDGTYFIIYGEDTVTTSQSVAFWFDVNNQGTQEPVHGADRSVKISTVNTGDSANTVAAKVSAVVNADPKFTASVLANVVTVTDIDNINRPAPSNGTSGFTVMTVTNGTTGANETVLIPTSVNIYPLANTAVSDIVTAINLTDIVKAVAVGNPANTISKATRDEEYTPAGPGDYSNSLAWGHDPDPLNGNNLYAPLVDGASWVQIFDNANPNFTLKKALLLPGVAPSVYQMDTCPNDDTSDLGEAFKLIPVTLNNVDHHFTQKALSQLPIISDIDFAGNDRRVQIKSKLLGSVGAIEVVGGRANSASFELIGDSQTITSGGNDYLEVKVDAFPDTFNIGDEVLLQNSTGVKRLSRLAATDTLDVEKISTGIFEYRYNPKEAFLNKYVKIDISDVSASYGRPAGFVWRWHHNDAGSLFRITSKTVGTVGAQPQDEVASGGGVDTPNLFEDILDPGTVSTALDFELTVSAQPTQADYFTFRNPAGVTFAAWFDIDGAGTPPTGASYTAATNKIMVSILSTDTPNQIVSKLATTLAGNGPFVAAFDSSQSSGATLEDVVAGDLVFAFGTLAGWSAGNKVGEQGDEKITGLPIVHVNNGGLYFDVVNPDGRSMSATAIGSGNTVQVCPTPIIRWNLKHAARADIVQIVVLTGTATATLSEPHKLNVGDTFDIIDSAVAPSTPGGGIGTVLTVPSFNEFTFATATGDGTYSGGSVLNSSKTVTRYRIESLGFNNMYRLSMYDGESPNFTNCGVAVDDLIVISGSTFKNNNNGRFRVLAVDNNSVIFTNPNGKEELNTLVPFNNPGLEANWTSSSQLVTGIAGTFENVRVGDWVKKSEDDDSFYRQVLSFDTGIPATATIVTLGSVYLGTTSTAPGIRYDQKNDVDKGVRLQDVNDILVLEGDSVISGDTLFVQNIVDASWFDLVNTGTFGVNVNGITTDYRPFLRVKNDVGAAQTDVSMAPGVSGLYITEALSNIFTTVRQVSNIAIDEFNDQRRVAFLTPADRAYKFSESNKSSIAAMGKLGYSTDVTTGVDGYIYYTGLLRTVQRVIDGFDPDPSNFPGRRAVGGVIEILPPLIKRVTIAVNVTTTEGVNLGEISNEIKSTVIDYVASLGVGEDVILSEIIRRIMGIKGVAAVTFITPAPSVERVPISDNEKAFAQASDISIA